MFQLREGDGENAFDIRGTVDTNEQHDFEIKDTDTLSVTVSDFDLNLAAGQEVTIEVGVNLGPMIGEIDFASMELNDGGYVIEKGVNPQIGTFRTRLSNAFSVSVVAPN